MELILPIFFKKKKQIQDTVVFKEQTYSTFGPGKILQTFHPSPLGGREENLKILFLERLSCIVVG